jgi:hypothetical protein
MVDGFDSRSDFDDLAFEDFERLLDQWIVLEIVFIEWNRREFFLRRRVLGRGGAGCGD